jgi:hypothetical protein
MIATANRSEPRSRGSPRRGAWVGHGARRADPTGADGHARLTMNCFIAASESIKSSVHGDV